MIKVFVGTEKKTEIPFQVLSYSIRKNTNEEVEIIPMEGPEWEPPAHFRQGTGFSLRRWMIPHNCDFQGKAIYLDADQLVFGDIAELWNMDSTYPNPVGKVWWAKQPDKYSRIELGNAEILTDQSSVMLINCEQCTDWTLDNLWKINSEVGRREFMHGDRVSERYRGAKRIREAETWIDPENRTIIPKTWNDFNHFDGNTKLLHYTTEPKQPWYCPDHAFAPVWREHLIESIREGYVTKDMIDYALKQWGVREDRRKQNGLHPDYAGVWAEATENR